MADEDGLDPRLLLLHPEDNVLIARTFVSGQDALMLEGGAALVDLDTPIGFKIARYRISAGSKVIKYGANIGSATHDIERGAQVHTHNMKSDYIAPAIHTSEG